MIDLKTNQLTAVFDIGPAAAEGEGEDEDEDEGEGGSGRRRERLVDRGQSRFFGANRLTDYHGATLARIAIEDALEDCRRARQNRLQNGR